jgi:hypothetical protein
MRRPTLTERFEVSIDSFMQFASTRRGRLVITIALILAACGATTHFLEPDLDLFTRVALGRLIDISDQIPLTDPWAYTPRKSVWHDHEIIPGILFYTTSQIAGDSGLFILKCCFIAITLGLIFAAQRLAGNATAVGLAFIALGIPDMLLVWVPNIRAQVMTFLCYALFLFAFARARFRGRDTLLLILPLVEIVWVNSHGGFIIGPIFMAIFTAIMWREKRTSLPLYGALLGVVLAPLCNPYGISFLWFICGAVTHLPPEISEWGALRPWTPHGLIVYGLVSVVLLGLRASRRVPLEGLLFIVVSGIEGIRHERLAPLVTMCIAVYGIPLFAEGLAVIERGLPRLLAIVRRSTITALILLTTAYCIRAIFFVPALGRGFSFDYSQYPVEAIEWLRNSRPGGKILTHYNDGSYVLWRMGTQFKISLDGRYDGLYPPETIKMGLEAYQPGGPAQRKALLTFAPDYILLGPTTPGLCEPESAPRRELYPGFSIAFSNGLYCVLEHAHGDPATPIVTRYPAPDDMWRSLW